MGLPFSDSLGRGLDWHGRGGRRKRDNEMRNGEEWRRMGQHGMGSVRLNDSRCGHHMSGGNLMMIQDTFNARPLGAQPSWQPPFAYPSDDDDDSI